ncbi:uncharacterized protein LOC129899830 [Solanum dulcamara]|uniref:uncharacterized protein LOC129899830 n=1 Tax=Solanum dulcamara TaxID=45834 RepID=UPI002486626B|nr:uncharacterized protein LOC129899830 [Solanum dulcamara]
MVALVDAANSYHATTRATALLDSVQAHKNPPISKAPSVKPPGSSSTHQHSLWESNLGGHCSCLCGYLFDCGMQHLQTPSTRGVATSHSTLELRRYSSNLTTTTIQHQQSSTSIYLQLRSPPMGTTEPPHTGTIMQNARKHPSNCSCHGCITYKLQFAALQSLLFSTTTPTLLVIIALYTSSRFILLS